MTRPPSRQGGGVSPKRAQGSSREGGFSLIEVIVATGLLATALVTLAQLFGLAMRSNLESRATTYATILAEAKVEELLASTGLDPSPATSLDVDTPGFVDHVDRFGHTLDPGANSLANGIYARRWSIQPLPADAGTLVIQVLVTREFARGVGDEGRVARLPGMARLVTVKYAGGN